jgi:UDP-N-acetylmuramate--alanine ligase
MVVEALRAAHPRARVEWIPERGALVEWLARELGDGDLCVSMGCGDVADLPDEVMRRRAAPGT